MTAEATIGTEGSVADGAPLAIPPRLVTDLLDKAVAAHGDWPAIDFFGRRWSYRALDALVRRAARGLQDEGVTVGTRVALCLPNTPYYVILYFAALRIGAVVVNLNPLYVERELRHLLQDSGATVIAVPDLAAIHGKVAAVAGETELKRIVVCPMAGVLPWPQALAFRLLRRRERARIPADGRHLRFAKLVARDAAPDRIALAPDSLAVLQYTGGTTGVPKAAMLSHANLAANSAQTLAYAAPPATDAQESVLGVLPLFHVFALTTVLNFSVETASLMILLPRFEMKQVLAAIRRARPTRLSGVPTIYAAFNALPDADFPDFASLRIAIAGGAPLPLEVRAAFEARSGCRVHEGYGLSEASPIVACNPLGGLVKDNSAGLAYPATRLEIRDPEAPHALLARGARGEVCARGPQVMQGYWRRLEDSAATFVDGALRTGDIGYLDDDGYLFLVDRIKDVILCGGYNVYPRSIEDALYEHPAVAEAVAIGVPDAHRGQSPKAFVALRPGAAATPEALRAFLAERLSKIELPREIEIRAALPKTLIGKLSKKELVEEERARAAATA